MKKIVLATFLAALSSASALAADLAPRGVYTKAPLVSPATNWSGFYTGVNIGYGWGNTNTEFSFLPNPTSFGVNNTALSNNSNGVIGGAQIGYNWQAGTLVAGLEADIQGSSLKTSATQGPFNQIVFGPVLGSALSYDQKLSWFGTVRGRVGVSVTPELLFYGTGGLAYGQVQGAANVLFAANEQFPASISQTKAGWTAGGGAEWAFVRNWSAKVEYLYVDLGKVSAVAFPTSSFDAGFAVANSWRVHENIVRVGVNYHFN